MTIYPAGLSRDAELYSAAELYYVQGVTMESIAAHFSVSRSTASRMLKAARDRGIVRISLNPPADSSGELSMKLQEIFDVTVHMAGVSPTASDAKRLESVARYAAVLVSEWFTDEMTLAVAWGATTSAVASQLRPKQTRGTTVVQMNGAVSARLPHLGHSPGLLSEMASAFGATSVPFPTPAFFDDERARNLMWRESTVRRVLAVRNSAHIALFSVGAFRGPALSEVYCGGYISEDSVQEFKSHRVVGDVCTVFLREDGTYADIGLNRRASGPTPDELRGIPRRACVVSGDHKIPGIIGALRAGVVTDLIIDDRTARALAAYLAGANPTRP